jgi:hypothetical protein
MIRFLFATIALLTAHAAAAQPAEPLFVHRAATAAAVSQERVRHAAVVSSARVGVRIDVLFERAGAPGGRVLLNTSERSWTASFERVDRDGSGFRSWVGAIDGMPGSHVVFTERQGIVSGLITADGATYQVLTEQPGSYLLEHVDTLRLRDERDPLPGTAIAALDTRTAPADEPSTIDVLILYTPAARAQRGGAAQVQALAAQVVSDTNTAFARSGVLPRVRLVGTRELPFVEATQIVADLQALRISPEARGLRDLARADLVQLLVSSPDQSACGVGYLLTSLGATDFDAYSVADIVCAAQYTPTHEMGHNLGSHHAPDDGGGGALFPYSYGFKDAARGFRTVMAYACAAAPCVRIPNFSNPAVPHNGGATGSASQSNARSINEAARTVANFRQSGAAPPTPAPAPGPTPPSAPTGLRSTVVDASVTVAWNPVVSGASGALSAATAYVLQVGTAPGLTNVFSASVGNTTSASGIVPGGNYFWRVTALNSAGASPPSAEAQFTVAATCTPPGPPRAFAFAIADGMVTLSWTAPNAATSPLQYTVEAGSAPALANLLVASVGSTTTVSTPAPPGTYYVRIRAHNACGISPPSNERVIAVP